MWETALALSGLTAVLIGPISGTLLWRIANLCGLSTTKDALRLMRIGIFLSLLLFVIIVPPAWIFRDKLAGLLHIPQTYITRVSWLLPGLIAMSILGGINDSMASFLNGYQRSGKVSLIQMTATLLQYGIIISALYVGFGFFSLLAGILGSSLISGTGYYWNISKIMGKPNLTPVIPTKADVHAMLGYAGLLLVGTLSSIMREQTDRLVLAGFGTSITLVACYGIAARLANLLMQSYSFFGIPMISAIGVFFASNDWQGIKRLYSNMTKIVVFCSGILVVLILGFYDRILVMWLGRNISGILPILALLLISNFIMIIFTGPGSATCRGIGKVGIETRYILIYFILNVVLTIGLVWSLGAIGTVIASAASMSISSLIFVWILYCKLDLERSCLRLSILSIPIVTICVIMSWWISASFPFPLTRLPAMFYAAILSLPVIFVYIFLMSVLGVVPYKKLTYLALAYLRGNTIDL